MRLYIALLALIAPWSRACQLKPSPEHTLQAKSPGDNHFRITVGDNPERYVPGKRYLVALMGTRTHSKVQKFTRFRIVAEPMNPAQERSPQRQGNFQLFADSMTAFDENCINNVIEVDDLPKTEVNVMWTAPKPGSGCVLIKAMVLDSENRWFAEDGQLTRIVCEDKSQPIGDCCACDDAKYSLTFEGIWSKETHPKDYPTQTWLIHFSDIIGATHGRNFSFWGEGKLASDGVRSLAEWGSIDLLERELKQEADKLRSLIKAPGLFYPKVNENTTTKFSVDRRTNLVSFISMFGPSPDWIVGVNGLDLCTKDCSWVEEKVVELQPYDAGTDNGITYMSPNAETMPHERTYKITPMYPEDPRAPFYNPQAKQIPPLARAYLKREQLVSRSCSDEVLQQLILESDDETPSANKLECRVSGWSDWSQCSVSCGKGLRTRTRKYLEESTAKASGCDRQLVGKEMCAGPIPECPDNGQDTDDVSPDLRAVPKEYCETSDWSDWSDCSCESGLRRRGRKFLRHEGIKHCPLVKLTETETCERPEECDEDRDPDCPTSEWSDWSQCSASCGEGMQMRMRILLLEGPRKTVCGRNVKLTQTRKCVVNENCKMDLMTAKQICMEEPDVGKCRSSIQRWAFIGMKGMCVPFIYSGCKGNRNNFHTQEDCLATCKVVADALGLNGAVPNPALFAKMIGPTTRAPVNPMDCQITDWSEWLPCENGYQRKIRHIIAQPKQGGAPCPPRMVRRRKCRDYN